MLNMNGGPADIHEMHRNIYPVLIICKQIAYKFYKALVESFEINRFVTSIVTNIMMNNYTIKWRYTTSSTL